MGTRVQMRFARSRRIWATGRFFERGKKPEVASDVRHPTPPRPIGARGLESVFSLGASNLLKRRCHRVHVAVAAAAVAAEEGRPVGRAAGWSCPGW